MANVITWSLEHNQHVEISLCEQHSETHGGLSQVQHGLHTGVCEDCLAERAMDPRSEYKFVVVYPETPGGTLTKRLARTLDDARGLARAAYSGRKDLLYFNVRIEERDGNLVEYGDGTGGKR